MAIDATQGSWRPVTGEHADTALFDNDDEPDARSFADIRGHDGELAAQAPLKRLWHFHRDNSLLFRRRNESDALIWRPMP